MSVETCPIFKWTPVKNVHFEKYVSVEQGSPTWHEHREGRIGASAAAAVFPSGISTTTTRADVKRTISGNTKKKEVNPFVQRILDAGNAMERPLLLELQKIVGYPIVETGTFLDSHKGFNLCSSLDGLIHKGFKEVCIAEFKWRIGEFADWNGTIGHSVYCQVQLQMKVTGIDTALVYVGCTSKRSLWVVRRSPKFWNKWLLHLEQLELNIKYGKGAKAEVEEFLVKDKKDNCRRILLPATIEQ